MFFLFSCCTSVPVFFWKLDPAEDSVSQQPPDQISKKVDVCNVVRVDGPIQNRGLAPDQQMKDTWTGRRAEAASRGKFQR